MELVIAGLMIVTLANPILLVWIWFTGVARQRGRYPRWRLILLWTGQLAVTLADLVFWASNICVPSINPQRDADFCRFSAISMILAAFAFVLATVGSVSRWKWIALSAVAVPLSWFTSLLVE